MKLDRPSTAAAALLAGLVSTTVMAGCDSHPAPAPPQPPALTSIRLVQAGLATSWSWEGQPAVLELTGAHLDDPTAPGSAPRLTATRIRDLDGRLVTGPEVSELAPITGTLQAQTTSLDLPAGVLLPGTWRVTLSDARGLLVFSDAAFGVMPVPVVSGLDRPLLCQGGVRRAVTLSGTGFINTWSLGTFVLQEGAVETGLLVSAWNGCTQADAGPFQASRCTSVTVELPDRAAGRGVIAQRFPGHWPPPDPAASLATITFETPAVSADSGLYSALDAPVEVRVWFGGAFVAGPGATPSARIGGVPLAVRAAECVPTGDPAVGACRSLYATIPQGFAPGSYLAEVSTTSGCAISTPLRLVERPIITGLDPPVVCQRFMQTLRFLGSGIDLDYRPTYSANGSGPWTLFDPVWAIQLPLGTHLASVESGYITPPVRAAPVWLTVYPGPPQVFDYLAPALVWSGARRSVPFWPSAFLGRLSARLVPVGGGAPVPVEVTNDGGAWSFTFPALGGEEYYGLEVSDETPCGVGGSFVGLSTVADPVLATWDFDAISPTVFVVDVGGGRPPTPEAVITPGAGVTGAAAVAVRAIDGADWYFNLYGVSFTRVDLGLLRFDVKASGTGSPSTAAGVVLVMEDRLGGGGMYQLRRTLAMPTPGAWTHYDVPLDDPANWVKVAWNGLEGPSTRNDMVRDLVEILILGSWWSGPDEAALDNVVVELAR